MSLSPQDQRALTQIETRLRRGAPELAGLLATFARLTGDEEMPARERLPRRRNRMRAAVLLPILFIAGLVALAAGTWNITTPGCAATSSGLTGLTVATAGCARHRARATPGAVTVSGWPVLPGTAR